jgi:hypothetical protein
VSADVNVTLTEKTGIRVTIAQAITIVGVLATVVSSGAIAWYAERTAREAHEKNIYVHFDPQFTSQHGLPVGKWDLAGRDDAAAASAKALQDQVDFMKRRVDALEAEPDHRRWRAHP